MMYCITTTLTPINEGILISEKTLVMYEDSYLYNKDGKELPYESAMIKSAFATGSIVRISEEDFNRLKDIQECIYHTVSAYNHYTLGEDSLKADLSEITASLRHSYAKFSNDAISSGSRIIR